MGHGEAKHGVGGESPEHASWRSMKSRCNGVNNHDFSRYGGRGIKVCDRWKNSYLDFLQDMGRRPDKSYSIDRIDVDGDYTPENCKWSSKSDQMYNRRLSVSNTSGYSGVMLHKKSGRWFAAIRFKGPKKYLKSYVCKHEAAMVYDMFKEKHNIPPYGN